MLGVLASNGETMLLFWFERRYLITSAVYKEVLETKVLSWVELRKKNYVTTANRTHGNNCARLVGRQHELLAHWLLAPQSPHLNSLDFSLWMHIEEKPCKTCHSNTDELKASVNRECRSLRKTSSGRSARATWLWLQRLLLPQKVASLINLMSLRFNILICYKSCLVFQSNLRYCRRYLQFNKYK